MLGRECALTLITLQSGLESPVFFIRDSNPSKPNRWLAIPHSLRHTINDMSAGERNAFWTAAIAKASELWGNDWAIAVNSLDRRSQCELHAHIGKLLDTADRSGGVLVKGPADIPLPEDGAGIWFHPQASQLCVHLNAPAGELNLMR